MRYINELTEGEHGKEIYLCNKLTNAVTKAGKAYQTVQLGDKTGTLDAKVWDPDSPGIGEFDADDYVWVMGEIVIFNDKNQLNIRRLRKAQPDEYDPQDYVPSTEKSIDGMYQELLKLIDSVEAPYYKALLEHFFVKDEEFAKRFSFHSAAKSVHHGYAGCWSIRFPWRASARILQIITRFWTGICC